MNLDRIDVTSDGPALMLIVFTGLVGGILWNVLTWLLGLPSLFVARTVWWPDWFCAGSHRLRRRAVDGRAFQDYCSRGPLPRHCRNRVGNRHLAGVPHCCPGGR